MAHINNDKLLLITVSYKGEILPRNAHHGINKKKEEKKSDYYSITCCLV